MATILNIDTSTEVCSVSLGKDGISVALREDHAGKNHAMQLTLFIDELLQQKGISMHDIDAVAVSGGPGSYTGLRIGVSTAKGICYASGKPLIAIPSLEAMAHHVISNSARYHLPDEASMLFCPMIDARRMEVYTAVYNAKGEQIQKISADIIDHQSFEEQLKTDKVAFFGNGSAKCRAAIGHENALFVADVHTSAAYIAPLAEKAYSEKRFVDTAYYEPYYLKDFLATVPTKNIIHTGQNL
jgi:tRNA threonylcarbamoyladenosine biosynthesis protein TsaB